MAPPCSVTVSGTVTSLPGAALRITVTTTELPSGTEYATDWKATVNEFCAALLMMLTVASLVVPRVASGGRFTKESFTPSPPSSRLSSVAVTVKVFSVSPLLNVTVAGTPE